VNAAPTIAVTGASGYVGSIIVEALSREGEVIGLVRGPTCCGQIAFSFDGDMDLLARRLRERRVTHLIHAAWDMQARSMQEAERSCVKGSLDLLAAARRAGVQRLIFISTISAFEGARSAYGRSKLEVEQAFREAGGLVLRLGLVHGERAGGAFGSMKKIVAASPIIPLIGDGRAPQYLLDEEALGAIVRRAARGELEAETRVLTLAHPAPVAFRDILSQLAASRGRRPVLVPIPWRLPYFAALCLERLGFRLKVKSDSILSFIYQDPAPDFGPMRRCSIDLAPFCCATPVSVTARREGGVETPSG
jgi:nucleoside-diphosphate-sugar epimerase